MRTRHRPLLTASFLLWWVLVLALVGCGGGGTHPTHGYQTRYGISTHPPGFATKPPPAGTFRLLPSSSTPTLEMFDTITLSTVPANPKAVAGYTSGYWPTYLPLVKAYPNALHLSIAVTAGHAADCLDDEPGDATPGQVVGWVRWQLSLHHVKPCVYASVSQMFGSINPLLAQAGLSGSVRRWCAWYRFVPGLISGCDAVQWTDRAYNRNLDQSTVALSFFNVTPPPPPDPLAVLDKTVRKVAGSSEYTTVSAFDHAGCKYPLRRPVCKQQRARIVLLRDRLYHVATTVPGPHPASFGTGLPSWGVDHRGARFQILSNRLH